MNLDCGSCGESFQAEGNETSCPTCMSAETQVEPQVMMETPTPHDDCYTFSELEKALFSEHEGQKTLARIITRMRVEGYDEEGWKVMIGLTAFAYKYYNCKGIPIHEQLRMLENAPLREVTQYMAGDISKLTEQVMNAESLKPSINNKGENKDKDAYKMIALALTALGFAYATRG